MTLSEEDFIFIKHVKRSAVHTPENDQLQLKMLYEDVLFKMLNDGVSFNIDHKIQSVMNHAPSLKQYWDMLMMTKMDSLNKNKFYDDATINFRSLNTNSQRISDLHPTWNDHKPIGFCTSEGLIPVNKAKELYCKLYQKIIMEDDTRKGLFLLIRSFCIRRNRDHKVLIVGRCTDEHTQKEAYEKDDLDFRWERCLIDMLIHYPKLDECVWNVASI